MLYKKFKCIYFIHFLILPTSLCVCIRGSQGCSVRSLICWNQGSWALWKFEKDLCTLVSPLFFTNDLRELKCFIYKVTDIDLSLVSARKRNFCCYKWSKERSSYKIFWIRCLLEHFTIIRLCEDFLYWWTLKRLYHCLLMFG